MVGERVRAWWISTEALPGYAYSADPGPLQCLNKDVSTFLRLARGETRNPRLGREGGGVGDGGGEGILQCVGDGERSQSELLAILADGDDGEGCFSTRLGGFGW